MRWVDCWIVSSAWNVVMLPTLITFRRIIYLLSHPVQRTVKETPQPSPPLLVAWAAVVYSG